jgi:hypothetical protein
LPRVTQCFLFLAVQRSRMIATTVVAALLRIIVAV